MDLNVKSWRQLGNKYKVFLSFSSGEDTQESFPSRLYSSLRKVGISIFKDDTSTELLRSILGGSRISIIIFTKHYASSRKCLEELTKIIEFPCAHAQIIFPIFYGVDQSEVHNQESSFGEAFQGLVQRISPSEDEVSRWRTALKKAGGNRGFVVPNFDKSKIDRDESEAIENIVKRVRRILDRKYICNIEDPVGVSSRMQEIITVLEKHRSKDVVSMGIWGMGGVGKTTLAMAVFYHIHHEFETTCFLSNVRETWKREGKVYLQKRFLSQIGEETDMGKADSIESASLDLKVRPCHKKVLLVVDDVDDLEQLHAVCGNHKRFGQGSLIIITARNSQILKAFQVDHIYLVKELSEHESLELFSRKAFGQASPKREYSELCNRVVAYSEGLPLALEVLGLFLCTRTVIEWESILEKLSTYHLLSYSNVLKHGFYCLDDNEKEIFLNIVLFHIGEDMNAVIQELDDRGCNGRIGMRVLVEKCLITIDHNNKLRVHNLLQLMGRQVLRETSQKELQNQGHRYDVFLSFRGEDTRATFVSHLYSALCNAGIVVFKDDVELLRGNHIKTEILKVIGGSRISIVIFSKKYAESKWCLEELSIIMELRKSNNQMVLPVFYNVDPSEIRNQTSSFGEAFTDLIKRISPPEYQVFEWKKTLNDAGSLAGIVVLDSRDEGENVKTVVENVCDILNKKDLFVAEHPVGVGNRVHEAVTMLQNHQSEDVVMVGLWGTGGIGKTTIAKAIYNEIGRTFESRSYLSKIRKAWGQKGGKVRLQNQLLSEICKTTKMKISSVESGKVTLKDRLRHKKALVVLDDVDKSAQLNALVGSRDWFKSGSMIIITTRNKRLLLEMDCDVYPMKKLDERESIVLFSWHAFNQESPKEGFKKLSRNIVSYSGGLPLALEVLGSYLLNRKVEEWEKVLKKLKKIPNSKIQKKLEISFDGLDNFDKKIFLDISCFFIGMDRNDVTHILNGCKFFADVGINTLVERSLVTIDEKNKLGMHDLLRDMGREIIRKQSENEPGERSRIWFHKDARAVLLKDMGTKAVEGLSLKLSQSEKLQIGTEAFKNMKRLRLLHLDNVQLRGDYNFISEDLRWLCWHGFTRKYIPSNFFQQKLVAIDLECSSLTQVWKKTQLLKKLKILNLSHSHYLEQTPNFSEVPNLEKLILKDCPSLSLIHHSIALLDKLLLLDLEDCIRLVSLPRSIYRLKYLKTLILSGCMNIEKLEEDIEQMESLTTLIAPTIEQVPFSLVRLKRILYLSICGNEGLPHHVIPSLYRSWISPTNSPLLLIPSYGGMPSSILWDMLNSIHGHPSTITNGAPKPKSLLLEDGLETQDSLCGTTNCMDILRFESCLGYLLIQIGKNSQVFCTLSEMVSQELNLTKHSDDCILPGDNYPYWRTFKGEGASVKLRVPLVNGHDHLKGMAICCLYCPSCDLGNKACESCISSLMIINYSKTITLLFTEEKLNSLKEEERKEIVSNLEPGDQVEVIAVIGNGLSVKKTTVYLIYNESFDEESCDEHMEPSPLEGTNLIGTKHKCEEEEEEDEEEAHQLIRPRKTMKI